MEDAIMEKKYIIGAAAAIAAAGVIFGGVALYMGAYQKGKQDGDLIGRKESYQSGMDTGYQRGYEEGYAQGSLASGGNTGDPSSVGGNASESQSLYAEGDFSGQFTVTVHEILPGYALDPTKDMFAAVSFFQNTPFLLRLEPEQLAMLETGKTYTMTLAPQPLVGVPKCYVYDGAASPEVLRFCAHADISEIRLATEAETGLDMPDLVYTE